ncbi:unnamed protein product [Owenia fusiformis]|uniref:Protein-PII uridylyltransferase N-terminal domain-containing protein n=1 Tax=Owenia fusiformis TaxID=6347 RepID=A0A8J1UA40_OWEFU|nr:unnamed protein product [Owenia fusiformis]
MGNSLQQWRAAIGTFSNRTSSNRCTLKFTRCWSRNGTSGKSINPPLNKSQSLGASQTGKHKHHDELDNSDHEPPTEKSVWNRGWIKRLTMREVGLKIAPTLLVISLIALMIGGVELNPGPRPDKPIDEQIAKGQSQTPEPTDVQQSNPSHTIDKPIDEQIAKGQSQTPEPTDVQQSNPSHTIGEIPETEDSKLKVEEDNPFENAVKSNKFPSVECTQRMYKIGQELCRKDWKTADMDETELEKQIDLFLELAVEYKRLFKETTHIEGWYFARSAGLLNAALNCIERLKKLKEDPLTEIEKDCNEILQELETTFLKRVKKQTDIPTAKATLKYQEELKQLRQYSDYTINSIVKDDMIVNLETVEMTVEDEERTIKNSRAFYNELTNKLVSFYKLLIDDCLNVLGTPNCRFCFVGLGSLARQEATAYSDLESAIIFDDTDKSLEINQLKTEFRLIVHYLHFKILNLGETVIPSLSIPVLNDFNKELAGELSENKFFDSISPQGLCFDGNMPWASKTPIGRSTTQNKPARELIMTPDEMSEYQKEDVCLKEGYHLSDVLMTTILIYGDRDVHDRYKSKLGDILKSPSGQFPDESVGVARATETLKDDLKKYAENPLTPETFSKQVHVKKDIYRFATISVNSLKLKYDCVAQSPLDVLDELCDRKILKERAKMDLQVMVCSCINLRHLTYNKYTRQKEFVSFISRPPEQESSTDSKESLSVRDYSAIYRFFMTFIPWAEFLKSAINSKTGDWKFLPRYIESSERTKGMLHKEMNFFENALLAFKKEEAQIMNSDHEVDQEPLAEIQASIGSLYKTNSMYQDALTYYTKALDLEMCIHNDQYHLHVATVLDNIGEIYWSIGNYENAIKYHQVALKIFKTLCESDLFDCNVAKSLLNLGLAHIRLGHDTVALSIFEESKLIYENVFGAKANRDYAELLEDIGIVFSAQNDLKLASSYYFASYSMRRKIWIHVPHADIATSLSNIADVYSQQGDLSNAMSYHNDALAMRRQVYGDKPHADIAASMSNIGSVYYQQGDLTNAMSYAIDDLAMYGQVYGDKPHADIATSLSNIGSVYYRQGDLSNAMSYHNDALAMRRQVYGDKPHADIATSMNNIGSVYSHQGDLTNAMSYYNDALVMRRRVYGDKPHAHIATSMNEIGVVYSHQGDLSNAMSYHNDALAMRRQVYGDKPHADIATSMNNIGVVYSQQGDLTNALSYYNDALAMWRQVYGDKPHANIATSMDNIGNVYYEQGDLTNAMSYATDTLAMRRQVFGDKPHAHIATSLNNIGHVYYQQGDLTNAMSYHTDALTMRRQVYEDKPHADIAKSMNEIAVVYSKQGDLTNAMSYHNDALTMRRQVYGDKPHADIATSLYEIGVVYSKKGDFNNALQYFTECLKMERLLYNNKPHNDITLTLDEIANVYFKQGDIVNCRKYFKESREMKEKLK